MGVNSDRWQAAKQGCEKRERFTSRLSEGRENEGRQTKLPRGTLHSNSRLRPAALASSASDAAIHRVEPSPRDHRGVVIRIFAGHRSGHHRSPTR